MKSRNIKDWINIENQELHYILKLAATNWERNLISTVQQFWTPVKETVSLLGTSNDRDQEQQKDFDER